jgi:TPR repeat protein
MAADQGQPIALNNLANMLDRGDPVGRDVTAALVFYRRAAAHGQANAAHSLATHYFSGRSIERDIEESYYWTLIAERGYSASERTNIVSLKRSILAEILETGGDRAAIEKRASQFRPLPAPPAPIPSAKPYVTP